MKISSILYSMLALCLVVGVLSTPTLADSNTPLYTGSVSDGWSKPLGSYGSLITFHISNGSNYVNVSISGPDYPSANNVIIPPGQAYYYYNALRIFVYSINSNSPDAGSRTAVVDISQPSASSSTSSSTVGTSLTCVTPGQTAAGGDPVTFPISIQNNNGNAMTYTLSASGGGSDWSKTFQYQGRNIYQVYVPAGQSQIVNLVVGTAYDSPIGAQTITVSTGDATLGLNVDITSINQSANIGIDLTSLIANIGDKIYYDFTIQNMQDQQNVYNVSVTGLPSNWYYEYTNTPNGSTQLSQVVVPALATKTFVLEILPPYSVTEGNYNFTAQVTGSNQNFTQLLALQLNGGVSMTVQSDQLAYTTQPGKTFTINVYASNTGNGGALTNVYPDITAPSGWVVSSSPSEVNSIAAGSTQTFTISVQPPGNIVASDYDVNVNVKSDQASSTSEYRITIATSDYIPYIAGVIILAIVVGLVFMYRKYGRR